MAEQKRMQFGHGGKSPNFTPIIDSLMRQSTFKIKLSYSPVDAFLLFINIKRGRTPQEKYKLKMSRS